MIAKEMFQHLAPKTITDVLGKLVEISLSGRDEVPALVLTLSFGPQLHGRIVAADLSKIQTLVLQQNNSISYVKLENIVAVTVVDARDYAQPLSFGGIDPAQTREPARPLSLNRDFAAFSDELREALGARVKCAIDWEGVNRDAAIELSSMGMVAEDLMEVMKTLILDEYGRKVILEKIDTIKLTVGKEPAIELNGKTLTVEVALTKGASGRFNKNEMTEKLNSIL